jgi:xylulokinase
MTIFSSDPCLIGIDVGSQSIRAIAFDVGGAKLLAAARPTPFASSAPGRGEYDPDTLFAVVVELIGELARGLGGRAVAGMSVASVGESCVAVDDAGRPVAPAIVWFDRRTEAQAATLATKVDDERVFDITGMPFDPTLTLFKLAWLRDSDPAAFARVHRVMMIADWITFRLSGVQATDPTLASRTLYFDIHERAWSAEMLGLIGLEVSALPTIRPSGYPLGKVLQSVLSATGLAGNPVVAVGGHDDLCGLFSVGLASPGMVLDNLGTGESLLLATDTPSNARLVQQRGYFQGAIGLHRPMSYIFGGIVSSGGAVEWLRSILGGASHADLIAEASLVPPGSDGLIFVPYLGNCPPPNIEAEPSGAFVGLRAGTTRGALYRAILEGLAMQSRLMLDGMISLPGIAPPRAIRMIGGGTRNSLFMSIKADNFVQPVSVVTEPEATALGAAILGGLGAGIWSNLDAALECLPRDEHRVEPTASATRYEELRNSVFARAHLQLKPLSLDLAEFRRNGAARGAD